MEICRKNVLFISLGVLVFLFSQVSDVSSATDTISTGTRLTGFETIVSSGDIFELGLFNPNPGINGYFYIGMWYKQVSPRTIVWVANRESPVRRVVQFQSISYDISFEISDGNLILYDTLNFTEEIWSTGLNSTRGKDVDVQAILLDSGNLVLRDGPTSSAAVLWQSFDHPSDTWLQGAKIKLGSQLLTSWKTLTDPSPGRYSLEVDPNTTNSLITVWNGSKQYWSTSDEFNRFLARGSNLRFKLNMEESYFTYSIDTNSTYHLVMDVSGSFMLKYWYDMSQLWNVIWSQPGNTCAVYNFCGSFGICNETQVPTPCRCVPGFRQSVNHQSDSNDFSRGYEWENKLQCGKGNDEFLPIENMKLATDPTTLVLTASLVTTCASANCSCNAYTLDGNKCLMWTTDAFNLQKLDANEGATFFLRVASSNISTATSNKEKTKDLKVRSIVLPVVLSSLAAAAAFFVGVYCCLSSRKKRRKRTQRGEIGFLHKHEFLKDKFCEDDKQSRELLEGGIIDDDGENMCYLNLHDIMAATNTFSVENKLGEGGFGPVYKGKLPNGMDVAIKRLSKKSSQGLTEFKNEVVLIIKLQHKNLVRLLGYCVEGDEKLLVYEYMSNKSLDVLLFDSLKSKELDWETRMKIVNGTTRGLQYLHEDSRLRIIHRDLKVSNILLDDEMNPKMSDFGTARIFGCKQIEDSTQRIVGTFGYMSPEYALGGMISEKSDIYSFGVLLLEIISGKKATRFVHNDQKHSLIAYAWESWCEKKV